MNGVNDEWHAGTPRRQAQIAARHPALEIRPLRGNLDTRIAKLDRGDYAAIVLAAAIWRMAPELHEERIL